MSQGSQGDGYLDLATQALAGAGALFSHAALMTSRAVLDVESGSAVLELVGLGWNTVEVADELRALTARLTSAAQRAEHAINWLNKPPDPA